VAAKIFQAGRTSWTGWRSTLHFISPNLNELKVIGDYLDISVGGTENLAIARTISERLVAQHVPVVVTTLGSQGVMVRVANSLGSIPLKRRSFVLVLFFFQVTRRASRDEPFYDENGRLISDSPIVSRLYPVTDNAKSREILSVSGCGDCLAAGIIRGIHANLSESECISLGLKTAALSLKSFDAVPQTLMDLSNANTL